MITQKKFGGFFPETVHFFEELKHNNNKPWFEGHKKEFENFVKKPAIEYINILGEKMRKIAPDIVAEPKVNRSIFKIYRDVRFSPDKRPFKTHLGIWLWEGRSEKRMENSGFYFHLEPPKLMLAAGMYRFPKHILKLYRDSVVDPALGNELVKAVRKVKKAGDYTIGDVGYKKIPHGYNPEHENAGFLLHNGLAAYTEILVPDVLFSEEIVDFSLRKFHDMLPIHKWLLKITNSL